MKFPKIPKELRDSIISAAMTSIVGGLVSGATTAVVVIRYINHKLKERIDERESD